MKTFVENHVDTMKNTAIAIFTLLFLFNISLSPNVLAQSPGEDEGDHTCYDAYYNCNWYDECVMAIICDIGEDQCPDERMEVEDPFAPNTCS